MKHMFTILLTLGCGSLRYFLLKKYNNIHETFKYIYKVCLNYNHSSAVGPVEYNI